ncbi:MAG TPA: divergent polysaccharide deacetylase family protein [bacterium]|nr:divergent polysaccharide deacetylase family protein [bacterium]
MTRAACIIVITLGLAWLCPQPGALSSAAGAAHPRVAIVFEHAGVSLDDLKPIYAMHQPFGLGIFPHQRYSAQIVRDAAAHGLTPLLHLPLEPLRPADLGPVTGIVWVRMADADIARTVAGDLDSVPGVVGVTSHAGSRATADRRVMTAVLKTIKARGVWFQENRTTSRSVALDVARTVGVRSVLVTTYLDDPPTNIDAKVLALLATAVRQGWAVAGAHITTGAPQIVARHLAEFQDAGVVFVPITQFVTAPHP